MAEATDPAAPPSALDISTEDDYTPTYGTESNENGADILFALIAAFLIGMLIKTVGELIPSRFSRFSLPYTAMMLLGGALVGVIMEFGEPVKFMTSGLEQLENISPAVIFAVFLPALVFPSGLAMEWHLAYRTAPYSLLLAIPGTLINAGLISLVAYYVLPYPWPLGNCFLFGSTLSATDPVAVVAIMHSVNANPKLSVIIEGESLLNDGVAYVIYEIFKGWAAGEEVSARGVVSFTFKAVFGGLGMGLVFGAACALWLAILFNSVHTEITVTLVTVYSLWLLCDEVLGLSGLLALVFCSIFMGAYGKYWASRSSADSLNFFWSWVEWAANTIIFFLTGLIIVQEVIESSDYIVGKDWGNAILLWVLLLAIRTMTVLLFSPWLRMGSYGLSWKDHIILSWAGLRGAVGLTLSLIVYQSGDIGDAEYRAKQFFLIGMMAVLTLLIQGSTTGPLLKALGYMNLPALKSEAMMQVAAAVEKLGDLKQEECRSKGNILGDADWEEVRNLTRLDLTEQIKKRPQASLKAQSRLLRVMAHRVTEAEVVDFRERLLAAVRAAYGDIFAAQYLRGNDLFMLQESIESALDEVDHGLLDWEKLKKHLTPIEKLSPKEYVAVCIYSILNGFTFFSVPSWEWRAIKASTEYTASYTCTRSTVRFIPTWLVFLKIMLLPLCRGKKGIFSQVHYHWYLYWARRDALLVSSYVYAHSMARRELLQFAELELHSGMDLERNTKEPTHSTSSGAAGHGPYDAKHASNGEVGVDPTCDFEPFWRSNTGADALAHTAINQMKSSQSILQRMPSSDRNLLEAAKQRVVQVVEESRKNQAAAVEHLDQLRVVVPEAVRMVRTGQVAVTVLADEQHFVERMYAAGVLDEKEVEHALNKIEKRMKFMANMIAVE